MQNKKKILAGGLVAVIIALVLSVVLGGGVASASRLLTGHDIKNQSIGNKDLKTGAVNSRTIKSWSIKLEDLSPQVHTKIQNLQNTNEAQARQIKDLMDRVAALEEKGAVHNGWVAKDGAQILDAHTVKLTNDGTPAGASVEIADLNMPVQALKVLKFTYSLENGAVYAAGSPRVYLEINGDFVNSFDGDPSDVGVDNGDGTFTKSFTIPKNGRVGAAGVVMDSGVGSITVTNVTIAGEALLFK